MIRAMSLVPGVSLGADNRPRACPSAPWRVPRPGECPPGQRRPAGPAVGPAGPREGPRRGPGRRPCTGPAHPGGRDGARVPPAPGSRNRGPTRPSVGATDRRAPPYGPRVRARSRQGRTHTPDTRHAHSHLGVTLGGWGGASIHPSHPSIHPPTHPPTHRQPTSNTLLYI